MPKVQKTYLNINGKALPTKIYQENRRNVRASIGKKAVILRMPYFISAEEKRKHLTWFKDWIQKKFSADERLHSTFFGKRYEDGDLLHVGNRTYTLKFSSTNNKSHSASLKGSVIYLKLSTSDNEAHLQKSIKQLLSRIVGQNFIEEISRKVYELNNLYFKKKITSVNLKYNHTNWGSCSSKGNLNLSTRLLFAPESVINYVIIHELAHLIELNHSKQFWKLVSDAMPDYKVAEKWLKENDHLCNF